MKTIHHNDDFSKDTQNITFDSLLNDYNCINQIVDINRTKIDNKQYSENILYQMDDHKMSSIQIYNNSAWNNDDNNLYEQSIEDIIKILIDFLGEFLLFLSSIIECKQIYSQFQLQKIVDIAERIHQLRLTLLRQINNINEPVINIPSILQILHELLSCIYCLSKEQQQQQQQQIQTTTEHSHTIIFTQLLDRLEKTIKSCIDCLSRNSNSQNMQTSISNMFPYLNSCRMIDNSTLSNICLPWPLLAQIKCSNVKDQTFGLMYGIKDENTRRKLGYRTGKHKSPNRRKKQFHKKSKQKIKRNDRINEEMNPDSNQEWTTSSTDEQVLVIPKASVASNKDKFKNTEQKEIEEKNRRISTDSRISQKKNSTNRLGSNRIISQHQSILNTKRSSPVSHSNFDIHESIKQPSIHSKSHLTVSDGTEHVTSDVTSSHTEELPITSMLEHSESQGASSRRLQQQQSNISKEDIDKSARSLSFQTPGHQTPSKTTIIISRDSNQSLSPVHSKSINTQQSNGSILSRKIPSINDVTKKKSISSIARSDDKRSFKETVNQTPISSQIHTDNTDSTGIFTSHDKIKHNDSISNKSWEQRLASPLSIKSAQSTSSTHLKQNIISSISNEQLSLNETPSDYNFDNYSQHEMSPSTSFLIEPNDSISSLNIIETPQSVKGEENTINIFDNNNKKDSSTSRFSPVNTYRQQTTSAASNSDDSIVFSKTKNHVSQTMTGKIKKFSSQETTHIPSKSNRQGYFNKFFNCFRKLTVNRIN